MTDIAPEHLLLGQRLLPVLVRPVVVKEAREREAAAKAKAEADRLAAGKADAEARAKAEAERRKTEEARKALFAKAGVHV